MDDLEYEYNEGQLREARLRGQRDEARRALDQANRWAAAGASAKDRSPTTSGNRDYWTRIMWTGTIAILVALMLWPCVRRDKITAPSDTAKHEFTCKLEPPQERCPTLPSGCLCPRKTSAEPPDWPVEMAGDQGLELVEMVIKLLDGQDLNPIDLERVREVLTDYVQKQPAWDPAKPVLPGRR